MAIVLEEKPIVIHSNVAVIGFDARKIRTHDDYLSVLDSARIRKQDVTKLGALKKFKPKKYHELVYGRLIPRGVLPRDLRFGGNKATDNGMEQINKLIRGASVASFTHNGVGTSNQEPAAGDPDLIALTERIAITERYPDGKTINHYDTFWLSSQGNGGGTAILRESDLNTAASGGVEGFRLTFDAFTKTAQKTANVAWTTTLASQT